MNLSIKELDFSTTEVIVDYFINSDIEFLRGMGVEKSKLPKREDWINNLKSELKKPYKQKNLYYLIWMYGNQPVGHSNVNKIEHGQSATMHLHLWEKNSRKKGLGLNFVKLTMPYYFKNLQLEKLICEPYSKNVAPNKVLKKLGFKFIRAHKTIPGEICFHQTVNRYELTKNRFYTCSL